MAESVDNIVTFGMKGMIGRLLVFSNRAGKTIVSKRPKATKIPPTQQQLNVRMKFSDGAIYAKGVMADAAVAALYAAKVKPGQSVYTLALADACVAPEVRSIDTSTYFGFAGNVVTIAAVDDFKVTSVVVTIKRPDGTVLEEGDAALSVNGINWIYTTIEPNNTLAGTVITAAAKDMPGNEGTLSKTV